MICLTELYLPVVYMPMIVFCIGKLDPQKIAIYLQDDLLKMEVWANTWKMVFNIDKCEVLQISLSNSAPVNYCFYDNPLRIVNAAKYLGVLLDSKPNFNRHIARKQMVC